MPCEGLAPASASAACEADAAREHSAPARVRRHRRVQPARRSAGRGQRPQTAGTAVPLHRLAGAVRRAGSAQRRGPGGADARDTVARRNHAPGDEPAVTHAAACGAPAAAPVAPDQLGVRVTSLREVRGPPLRRVRVLDVEEHAHRALDDLGGETSETSSSWNHPPSKEPPRATGRFTPRAGRILSGAASAPRSSARVEATEHHPGDPGLLGGPGDARTAGFPPVDGTYSAAVKNGSARRVEPVRTRGPRAPAPPWDCFLLTSCCPARLRGRR